MGWARLGRGSHGLGKAGLGYFPARVSPLEGLLSIELRREQSVNGVADEGEKCYSSDG
jgi:hypothetical protein